VSPPSSRARVCASKRDGCSQKSLDSKTTASTIIGSLSGASQQCIASKRLKLRAAIDEVRAMALARVNG
jgi:hypothetical protein